MLKNSSFSTSEEMEEFCQKLPKIELHAHLNGSLSKNTLLELGCDKDLVSSYQNRNSNIEHVFKLFKVAHDVTNTSQNLYVATERVIREFANDKVVYLELRTTPRSGRNMTETDYIETVVKAIQSNESSEILVKLILSLDRRLSYENQTRIMDLIIAFKNKYPNLIKGVDLSGDPAKGEFFKDLFQKARDNGLFTAIHCAEIKNDQEVEAILDFKPDRLGHGTVLHPFYGGNEKIWEAYVKAKIPVECCLTSNVLCKTIKSYKDHHVNEWIKGSLPFCLATDDKGVFDTTLSKEFLLAHDNFNLNKSALWNISKNSVDYSFASAEEKKCLKQTLDQWKTTHL